MLHRDLRVLKYLDPRVETFRAPVLYLAVATISAVIGLWGDSRGIPLVPLLMFPLVVLGVTGGLLWMLFRFLAILTRAGRGKR